MKYIKEFESLLFSGYPKFSVGDIVVFLADVYPFEKDSFGEILKVDEDDKKLPYKIGKVENKVDYGLNYSKYLDEIAWSHGDILRKAEPYELEQIKYNL